MRERESVCVCMCVSVGVDCIKCATLGSEPKVVASHQSMHKDMHIHCVQIWLKKTHTHNTHHKHTHTHT